MKKLLSIVLVTLMVLSSIVPAFAVAESEIPAGTPNVPQFWLSDGTVDENNQVTLTFSVKNNPGFWAARTYLVYPECLKIVEDDNWTGIYGADEVLPDYVSTNLPYGKVYDIAEDPQVEGSTWTGFRDCLNDPAAVLDGYVTDENGYIDYSETWGEGYLWMGGLYAENSDFANCVGDGPMYQMVFTYYPELNTTGATELKIDCVFDVAGSFALDEITYDFVEFDGYEVYGATVTVPGSEPSCEHANTYVENEVEPTCAAEGYTGDEYCSDCGELVKAGSAIPTLDHEYFYACDGYCMNCYEFTNPDAAHSTIHVEAVEATCFENGNIEYWTCEYCGVCWDNADCTGMPLNRMMVVVPAGHTEIKHVAAVEATCFEDGNIEYWYCEDCGYAWLDEECTLNTNLKAVVLPMGHGEIKHVDAKDSDCFEDGNIEYWYCEDCGYAWLDEACTLNTNLLAVVTPAQHAELTHVEAVAPTCFEDGNIEYWYCEDCGFAWLDAEGTLNTNLKAVILPAAHGEIIHVEAVASTCFESGNIEYWYCAVCGYAWLDEACTLNTNLKAVMLPSPPPQLVHVEAKAPTCTENGNIEYWYCELCGYAWLDEECTLNTNLLAVVLPAAHTEYKWRRLGQNPTTTEAGYSYAICAVCREYIEGSEKEIPAVGEHYYSIENVTAEPGTTALIPVYVEIPETGFYGSMQYVYWDDALGMDGCVVNGGVIAEENLDLYSTTVKAYNEAIADDAAAYGIEFAKTDIFYTKAVINTLDTENVYDSGVFFYLEIAIPEDITEGDYEIGVLLCDEHVANYENVLGGISYEPVERAITATLTVEKAPCAHNIEHVEAVAPTCFEEGNIEYWYCTECGFAWLDADCTLNTNLQAVKLAPAHAELTHVEAVAPTCFEEGNIEYWTCEVCGYAWLDAEGILSTNLLAVKLPAQHTEYHWRRLGKNPTTTEAGYSYAICAVCREYIEGSEKEIPAVEQIAFSLESVTAFAGETVKIPFYIDIPATGLYGTAQYFYWDEALGIDAGAVLNGEVFVEENADLIIPTTKAYNDRFVDDLSVYGIEFDKTDLFHIKPVVDTLDGSNVYADGVLFYLEITVPEDAAEGDYEIGAILCDEYVANYEGVLGGILYEPVDRVITATLTVVPAECKHNIEHVEAVAPTCFEEGNIEYWYCTECGYAWLDAEGVLSTNLQAVKLAPAHAELTHVEAVAPTCFEEGNIEYWTCEVCGYAWLDAEGILSTNLLAVKLAPAHAELTHVEAVAPTCFEEGNIEYWYCEVCGYAWLDAEGILSTNLQAVKLAPAHAELTHVEAVAPTCFEEGNIEYWYCEVCGYAWLDAEGILSTNLQAVKLAPAHAELTHVEAVAPTCFEEGNIEYWYCEVCGYAWLDAEGILSTNLLAVKLAPAHAELTHVEAVAPTCTEQGNIEYWTCEVCGYAWLDADGTLNTNLKAVVLPETGHTAGEWTAEGDKLVIRCTVCGELLDEKAITPGIDLGLEPGYYANAAECSIDNDAAIINIVSKKDAQTVDFRIMFEAVGYNHYITTEDAKITIKQIRNGALEIVGEYAESATLWKYFEAKAENGYNQTFELIITDTNTGAEYVYTVNVTFVHGAACTGVEPGWAANAALTGFDAEDDHVINVVSKKGQKSVDFRLLGMAKYSYAEITSGDASVIQWVTSVGDYVNVTDDAPELETKTQWKYFTSFKSEGLEQSYEISVFFVDGSFETYTVNVTFVD